MKFDITLGLRPIWWLLINASAAFVNSINAALNTGWLHWVATAGAICSMLGFIAACIAIYYETRADMVRAQGHRD